MPWLKPLTDAKARERVYRESVKGGRNSPDCYCWEQEIRCLRVRRLAKAAIEHEDGPQLVYLTSSDLDYIT